MLGVRFSHFDPRADIEADAEEHRHPPFSERDLVFTDLQFNFGRAADAPPCGSRRPGLRSGTGPRTRAYSFLPRSAAWLVDAPLDNLRQQTHIIPSSRGKNNVSSGQ